MPAQTCPHCGADVSPYDKTCGQCGKGLSGRALLAPSEQKRDRRLVARLFWILPLLAVPVSVFIAYVGIVGANGAPQEAAAAGIACFICIAPYVLARTIDELIRD
jgi:predicted nucleic acid-binding Zn ribbon protein